MENKLSKSSEDYLEAIYLIKTIKKVVRVKDIASNLGIKLPSVTEAVGKLSEKGFVKYERYGFIELTKKGEVFAKGVYQKHKVLLKFFTKLLGLDKKTALQDACNMEHGLSKKTLIKLMRFIKKSGSLLIKNKTKGGE